MAQTSRGPTPSKLHLQPAVVGEETAAILDAFDDPVFILDERWRYRFINSIGLRLMESTAEQVLGRVIWDVFPNLTDADFYRAAHQAMTSQRPVQIEEYYPYRREWYDTKFYPLQGSLITQMRNISELKEEQRVNSQLTGSLQDAMEIYWHGKYGVGSKPGGSDDSPQRQQGPANSNRLRSA